MGSTNFFTLNSFPFITKKTDLLSITFFADIETKQEKWIIALTNRWKSKIGTHNFLDDRCSSISDINRLINIHYIEYNKVIDKLMKWPFPVKKNLFWDTPLKI